GRTREELMETYTRYLLESGIDKIKRTEGNLGVQVLRRLEGGIVRFITISRWESRAAIQGFAGTDIEKPHHLPKDEEYLLELPQRVEHFDILLNTRVEGAPSDP